jgi:hypothetical protein
LPPPGKELFTPPPTHTQRVSSFLSPKISAFTATFSRPSSFFLQKSPNVWEASSNDSLHATDDLLHATKDLLHATDDLLHATDDLLHATEDSLHATDDLLHATKDLLHATVTRPKKTLQIFLLRPA